METIATYNPHRWGNYQDIETPVRWKRREWGGWTLVHAKTGRNLGWIVPNSDKPREWDVRICSTAFRGESATDPGDVLDKVPAHLYNGDPHNSLISFTVGTYRTRHEAAREICRRLVRGMAPALGFPRHPEVYRWADR